ncbi:MAG: adenylate/guanylate cyclase domain-containing protein [Myxococcota bacterium]
MTREPAVRFPFRRKLALFATALAAVPLLAMGVILTGINADALARSRWQLQIAIADDLTRTLAAETSAAEDTLEAIAGVLTDADLPEAARLAAASRLLEGSRVLDQVTIYDERGAMIDTLRQDGSTTLPAPPQVDGDLGRGLVVVGPRGAQTLLSVALEVGTERTGTLVAPLSLASLQTRVERLTELHLATEDGSLRVVDSTGLIVASSSRESVGTTHDDPILEGVDAAALQAPRSGDVGESVATIAPLTPWPWVTIVEVPAPRAYAPIRRMQGLVGVGIAVALIAAILLAITVASRITAPIQALSRFARDLAARRFDQRVDVGTDDELGLLSKDLSLTAEALQQSEAQIRTEQAIRADLGRFLPAELARKVARREHDMELGGRRLPITALFADVVAFTPLSAELRPEDTVALLNELFTLLTEVVFRHGGTVDKFVGDAVMALFGAPDPQDDHGARALRAAVDMLAFVESANPGWRERFGVTIQLAIGVNSGDAVVGNIGSDTRMDYTAIGDVINIASRLEAMARPNQILVSAATRAAAGEEFRFAALGDHPIEGRAPLSLFEVQP